VSIFIIMAVVVNFNFSYFLRLMWEFLGFEIKRGGSVCWPNNKIIDCSFLVHLLYMQDSSYLLYTLLMRVC